MAHYELKRDIALLACALVLLAGSHAAAIAGTVEISKAGAPFSMEFRDADIRDVLRAVGQAADMNLIVSDTVNGQVSLSLKDVDIWAAMEAILKSKGLTYVRDANMVRVVAVSEARDNDMETRVFPLGNASSQDVLPVVEKIKSDRAKISVDGRMNAIVVKDLSLNLDQMARLLRDLDVHIPQVLIEAKIVEVSRNYARELGVQWGGQHTGTSGRGTTVVTGGTTGVGGTAGGTAASIPAVGGSTFFPQTGDIGRSGSGFVVNLPAAVGPGSGGALGISFGKLGGNLSLDLQLSAMQTTGNGKILSSPKVLTVNNKEAKISSGTDIPVRIVSATSVGGPGSTTTAGVQTISATLALSAIPTIMSDNRIAMVLKVDKSEPDFSRQVDGIPTVTRRSADTHLVVNDGETVVLGGIITKSESQSESGVPFLSDIPVIGWLFKKKSKQENETELMIFITPTIMKD